MGKISREEFIAQQEKKANNGSNFSDGPRVGYFSLKNDNDEAVVRFIYTSEDEVYDDIVITHKTHTTDGKFRRINCLRNYNEPISKCPFCSAGEQSQQRIYLKMLEYTRDDNGNITTTPKIWERPTSYVNSLIDKINEYGNLSDCIFKVKRHGRAGDMKTTYSIDLANPNIYNSNLYPKDFSAFESYEIIGTAVLDKTFDEMVEMLPSSGSTETNTTTTTSSNVNTSAPRRVTY